MTEIPGNILTLAEEKQAILSAIIATSDDSIISKTLQGIITSWNPAAELMFGYTETEAIGQHISLIIPKERIEEEAYIIGQIAQGNRVHHFETVRVTKNGKLVPISLSVSPIINAEGIVIGASKIARDITIHQLADEKQAILGAIINSSDDAIISKTLKGIITSWNPSAVRLFGYSEQEAIGKHISLIIPKERLSEEDEIIRNITAGRKVDHFETMRLTKDGRLIPISVTISPVMDRNGRIIGASKIARDISERKKAVEKQGILAAIIDSSDDTILSKTLEGIITSWNKAAEKMFGYTEAEALGRHISLIIPSERLDEERFIISEVSKGNKVDHFQTIRLAKDGRKVHISLSVSPVIDSDGKIIGASKIARDVTEQYALELEKARLYEQVKEMNEKKDEFIAVASHELKTPLSSISGYLQILSGKVTDEQRKQFLHKAGLQVKKLSALVADLLDMSKIEAGKLPLSLERFDLRHVVTDVIDLVSQTNLAFTITLESNLSEVCVTADPHRIEQVLINLLSNAIRYSPGTDRITVHLEQEGKEVKVGIHDKGMGIPADKLEVIFSRFYRINEHSPHISGLGLGLYLSQQIIQRHHGRIWAESEPGKGSTFWFALPAMDTCTDPVDASI